MYTASSQRWSEYRPKCKLQHRASRHLKAQPHHQKHRTQIVEWSGKALNTNATTTYKKYTGGLTCLSMSLFWPGFSAEWTCNASRWVARSHGRGRRVTPSEESAARMQRGHQLPKKPTVGQRHLPSRRAAHCRGRPPGRTLRVE